jgi:diaminopimelate decarboxylase
MPLPLTVVISGCHSGPNPSPGLGIARSLRAAFPGAHLVARDVSNASSGLHSDVFDETWVCPASDEVSGHAATDLLLSRLTNGWLVSGLDLEVRSLTRLGHERILVPSSRTLLEVAKPELRAARSLPVRVPDWLPLAAGEQEVQSYCRRHDWRVWVKGPVYESRPAASWQELQAEARSLERTWGTDGLFVQASVEGAEMSVAFAAFRGELLGAVVLEKYQVTEQGKVWAGSIEPVPAALLAALQRLLKDLEWTGGGELECVREREGELWLFDWNPRFPAWIHGATLAGHNLPGMLLGAATGLPAVPAWRQSSRFVRQVIEVPTREALPHQRSRASHRVGAKKWAKGVSALPRVVPRNGNGSVPDVSILPSELVLDLQDAVSQLSGTPTRMLLRRTAESRFAGLSRLVKRAGIGAAYSIKTNPDSALMTLARRHGLLAEAIGEREVEWALQCGFSAREILVNGPVPIGRRVRATARFAATFADDPEGLERYLEAPRASVVGVRLRPPFFESRFGVPLESRSHFGRLVELFRSAPAGQALGVSFHAASSELGLGRWERLVRNVIDWAAVLGRHSAREIALVDLGGGWAPEDVDPALKELLTRLATHARSRLGRAVGALVEPGKALVQPAQAVIARVVHIRRGGATRREAILDAGIGDLPQLGAHPHRLAVIRGGLVEPLQVGPDRLLGPLCMESDRIAEAVALPPDLALGDLVAICDAGAYDASMAFALGRGRQARESGAVPIVDPGASMEPVLGGTPALSTGIRAEGPSGHRT